MKILHISGARSWGGNEQQLMDLIPELEKLNASNIVFGVANSPLEKECKERKIPFIVCKDKKLNKFSNYKFLKQLVKEHKPDAIHLHTSDSLTVYTISDLLYGLKTPTVFSKKGMGGSSSILSKFKYNYKNVSATICISEKVRKEFSEILTKKNREKLVVIYDAVSNSILEEKTHLNLREKYKIPAESLIIGNIANHNRAKDLMIMVETADYLINLLGTKNVFFVQIGQFTELTAELQNKVKEKKLENHFVFTDKIPQAYRFNHQFDIFVMTSEREGGPTSVLEAMYLEKPIVSTNVGIVPEIIKNGENGYVSDVKDYISLAKNIQTLVMDSEKRRNIVKGNKELIIKNNSSLVIAQKTLQLYKDIAK